MSSRYNDRKIVINRTPQYKQLLKDRNVPFIRQYFTANLHHPTVEEVMDLNVVSRVWKMGDRYFKLAYEYYGDSKLWWVIAWYNQKPSEADVKNGDIIEVPLPLDKVLGILKV